jgi:hypothetical protein
MVVRDKKKKSLASFSFILFYYLSFPEYRFHIEKSRPTRRFQKYLDSLCEE